MNPPTVAICIPTYNQALFLEGAVRSAFEQSYPCEVFVSDDASTDDTQSVIERLSTEFPSLKYFRHARNLGMSGNPRWIVQKPDTDFIVKLDSDDRLHPNFVARLVDHLCQHPRAGYAHSAVQQIDANGHNGALRLLARSTGFQSGEQCLRESVSGYRVAANICMFRRAALQEVNYFRPDLPFADDWDLSLRLADAGWGNVHVQEVLADYRVWDTASHQRSRRKLQEISGCERVIKETLVPAFERRKWDLSPVRKAARRMALRHAECLRSGMYGLAEQEEIKRALLELGPSRALRLKFLWVRTPIAWLFGWWRTVMLRVKLCAKKLRFRQASSENASAACSVG